MKKIQLSTVFEPLSQIVSPLLEWYDENKRTLPWREVSDPYAIWVSEIMLQQTRVEAVISYYERFMQALPTLQSLANVSEEKLLKLWEGLGYYNRVRNLQKAAQLIMNDYAGEFPQTFEALLQLPGVGEYTAGAISSIAFEHPTPAVDGNVMRVITRVVGYEGDITLLRTKAEITEALRGIYPAITGRCGDFTQSLMELGALVCLPNGAPNCAVCPLCFLCSAFQSNRQENLPVKTKKKPRKTEERTVFLLCCGDKVAVSKRAAGGLLGGLFEFPNLVGRLSPIKARAQLGLWQLAPSHLEKSIEAKHIFTHIEWHMTSYLVSCESCNEEFLWVTRERLLDEIMLPSAFKLFCDVLSYRF